MSETVQKRGSSVDEIDLTVIFAILWRRRKLILFGTLAATLLAAGLSFFIPKTYRSEGFYQLGNPESKIEKEKEKNKDVDIDNDNEILSEKDKNLIGIPIPLYKKSVPLFFNSSYFLSFVSQEKSFSKKELDSLKVDLASEGDISKWIKPIFAFAREDMVEFAQLPRDISNSVLGFKLSYEADSPQKAYSYVRLFGQYVRDCLLYVSLNDYIKDKNSKVISELNANENDIIDLQFDLLQNAKKMLDIKAILTKYPETAKIENSQIVSVQNGGYRYLGPVTQLVGIESALADQRRDRVALEREKEMLVIRREYFSKCDEALNKLGRQGEMIFSRLKAIKYEVFKNQDFQNGAVKEVFNYLNIDLQAFDLVFFTNCRFISGPTFPLRHIKPRKSVIVILTCFFSFFTFVLLAFVLHWWQNNKKRLKSLNFL